MTREEKVAMLNENRDEMRRQFNEYWERGNERGLELAAHHAAIMSALLVDLD